MTVAESKPPIPATDPNGAQARGSEWLNAAAKACALSWFSLVYMGFEGGIAITAAILAGSVALLGLGVDSLIEGCCAAGPIGSCG